MRIFEIQKFSPSPPPPMSDLTEQFTTSFDDAWNKYIVKDCSKFIDICAEIGRLMYRGVGARHANMLVYRSIPREHRRPLDSDPVAQKIFDDYLKKIGIKALRSNSIFVTSSSEQAKKYGTLYVIFPLDSAYHSVSESRDLTLKFYDILSLRKFPQLWKEVDDFAGKSVCPSEIIDEIGNKNSKYPMLRDKNLGDYVNHEVLKNLAPDDTEASLRQKIMYGGEILISGRYYAFRMDTFYNEIKHKLFNT